MRIRKNRLIALIRNNQGVTALETALVMPVFLLLMFGIIEFGLMMHVSSLVENATHEAARKGSTGNDYSDLNPDNLDRTAFIQAHLRARLGGWASDDGTLSITTQTAGSIVNFNPGGAGGVAAAGFGQRGEAVLYIVTYNWRILTPMMGQIIGTNGVLPIRSTVVVQNENF
jgi:Flp pilus assembly protein TadG